jgi:ABC-type sugar transport system ATPase subunit
MATVVLDDVKKAFGPVQTIHGVDLDIRDREFVVFVGPSGCGKSTLLRLVAGLEDISSGDLYIDGERVNALPPAKRGIAMVFQSYALYPHMTVYENMAFGLRRSDLDKAGVDRRVRKAGEMLQLSHLLDRLPRQLSGGQRQRVAIGRAIVRDPKVFLFDEPLSNLDAALRIATRLEIAKLVATFLGSPTMNILPATVTGVSHGAVVVERGGSAVTVAVEANGVATGEAVKLGIRPENLSLTNPGDGAVFSGEVDVLESLGESHLVHVRVSGGERIVVRGAGDPLVREGETVGIAFDAADGHLFRGDGEAVRRVWRALAVRVWAETFRVVGLGTAAARN